MTYGSPPNFASTIKQINTLLYPLKSSENHRFIDDFRGEWKLINSLDIGSKIWRRSLTTYIYFRKHELKLKYTISHFSRKPRKLYPYLETPRILAINKNLRITGGVCLWVRVCTCRGTNKGKEIVHWNHFVMFSIVSVLCSILQHFRIFVRKC